MSRRWLAFRARYRGVGGREAGVTITELLAAIVISSFIVGVLGFGIYFGTRTTSATETRLIQSDKLSLLSNYLAPDVQSSISAQTSVSDGNCGAARVVDLLLTEKDIDPATGSSVLTFVSYYRQANGARTAVYRRVCNGSAVISGPLKVTDSLGSSSANPAVNPFQFRPNGASWEIRVDLVQQRPEDAAVSATKNALSSVLEVTKRVT